MIELAREGRDVVVSLADYTLTANVEALTLSGSASIDGIGNALHNVLRGNGGSNALSGGAGDDVIRGGGGNDRLIGGAGSNSLLGDVGNDRLIGGQGRDTLDGGTGADLMQGGDGNDLYSVDSVLDQVVELAGEGLDGVVSSRHYVLPETVEFLTLSGSRSINGAGNAADNELRGNLGSNVLNGGAGDDLIRGGSGNDQLVGGTGFDHMQGGEGNDRYYVDSINDLVSETFGEGIDSVFSTASHVLRVENLVLTGDAASFGIGNWAANDIRGNGAGNLLRGEAGNDLIFGGGGSDRIEPGSGTERVAGGSGADVFVFRNPREAGLGAGRDTILDFERGDLVHLAAIDADVLSAGDQAFDFIGAGGFSGIAGELHYAGGVLAGDVDGDGSEDFQIGFAGGVALAADDLLL